MQNVDITRTAPMENVTLGIENLARQDIPAAPSLPTEQVQDLIR